MIIIQVSLDTDFFVSVEIYSGDVLEMAGHSGDTRIEIAQILFRTRKTEVFESVEMYLEDCLEMASWW